MLKKIIAFTPFFLSACTQSVSFLPEKETLNEASAGTPYYAKIEIIGGRVLDRKEPGIISPGNSGLHLEYCDPTSAAKSNCLEIKGIPVSPGTIEVYLRGMVFGNMFVSPGRFEKTYEIKVVAGKE